ncbi:hypothetical protein DdX_15020 [Ditylenchus destructor]|uniref:Uncharacterized protein n=1 Tax=Ditylenchus destructor TaxID=166010 RepID=A0AAD4MSA6_9BILA|nr:hypothetical protein DdX_15020 [Ditylenchus destructor]
MCFRKSREKSNSTEKQSYIKTTQDKPYISTEPCYQLTDYRPQHKRQQTNGSMECTNSSEDQQWEKYTADSMEDKDLDRTDAETDLCTPTWMTSYTFDKPQ